MSSVDARPVVVGYDGSELAGKAVAWAAEIAQDQGDPLVVLFAADRIRYTHDAGVGLWTPTEAHASAMKIAERGVEIARKAAPDVEVSAKSSLASPPAALEEISLQARLIVVGNSGRGRVSGILLGSTAYHVASLARCPVTIVPPDDLSIPGPDHKVTVATDGSPSASRAVRQAADVAARYDAPLEILAVWERPFQENRGKAPDGYKSMSDAVEARATMGQSIVEDAEREALHEQPELTVSTQVLEGRPELKMSEAAKDSAVLILGARGRSDLASLLLGSTSRAVLHHAKCPVQIIR